MPLRLRRLVAAALVTAGLAACGGADGGADPTTATGPSSSPSPATAADASNPPRASEASTPVGTEAPPADVGSIAGAELVCPAVATALGIADGAGWVAGSGTQDSVVTASLSASLVIDLTPDLPFEQISALWDAADSIAAAGCPDDAQRLVAVYGASSIRDILGAA